MISGLCMKDIFFEMIFSNEEKNSENYTKISIFGTDIFNEEYKTLNSVIKQILWAIVFLIMFSMNQKKKIAQLRTWVRKLHTYIHINIFSLFSAELNDTSQRPTFFSYVHIL